MILKDGADVPRKKVRAIVAELQRCPLADLRLMRAGAYGRQVPRAVLEAHPALLHRGKLSAAAAAVIMNAVEPDGGLTWPGME